MPTTRSGKRTRVPWKPETQVRNMAVTLPVFIAYCGIAASLRAWNIPNSKFIVTLQARDDFYYPVYAEAAEVFAAGIWQLLEFTSCAFEWKDRSFRDEMLAHKNERAIFIAPPDYNLDDGDRLFSDAVLDLNPRTRRHAEAALRRAGLPPSDRDVELLLSEPWPRLVKAFQERRHPILALERLRSYRPVPAKAVPEVVKQAGPALADMHGYGPALDWGNDLAKDLADYKAGVLPWSDVDAGVLLSGPPGVGKTMFASALANTCRVPIIYGSVSQWQEAGALDNHLKAMRASFAEAKAKAPSILFIDEVDTFGDRTEKDRNSGYFRSAMAGFLELMDGFDRRQGVVVVGACNYPDQLDPAVRRAGRLDRHFEITLPDAQSRLSILGFHSGIELDQSQAEKFGIATGGLSGADIEQLVRDAKRAARRRREALSGNHVIEQLRPLTELTEEYVRALAVHEAGHALVAIEIGYGQVTEVKISRYRIDGKSGELGYVQYGQTGARPKTSTDYLNAIAVCLGGIAAELEIFGSFADGSSGSETADLNRATELATMLEGGLGMGHTLVVEGHRPGQLERLRTYNPELRMHVHDVLQREFERARSIIQTRRTALDAIVERLMEAQTMTGDDVVDIVQRHKMPRVSLAKLPRRGMGA
ncbi:ATP-dependent peptidase M41 family protein [Rhizobium etli 8C-3]|uniref:ATP-dependent peptidase M41 family protein n=1 Tax=Rhizobium etli 8C-3 TaxID=538025 RepID=A0A1L5P539_RHIET|nr:AAA family ATPase [Rhizobium etli]APO75255.1 ATP-dependent peptidase M41 family protein [Rhizobium etli 8C-3]